MLSGRLEGYERVKRPHKEGPQDGGDQKKKLTGEAKESFADHGVLRKDYKGEAMRLRRT